MFIFSLTLRHTSSKAQKGSSIATTANEAYVMINRPITTTINEAYDMIKLEQKDEHMYNVIDVSGGTNPSLTDKTNKNSCPPLSHQPLPAIPSIVAPSTGGNVDVAIERKDEVAYATIPGDQ